MNKVEIINGLRELADALEKRDFPESEEVRYEIGMMRAWCETPEVFSQTARALGSFDKSAGSGFFDLHKQFGPIVFEATISREKVCHKKVIGTRIIEATPERYIPAEPERTEELVEWECPDSVLALNEPKEEIKDESRTEVSA